MCGCRYGKFSAIELASHRMESFQDGSGCDGLGTSADIFAMRVEVLRAAMFAR
jgi:hypothetical protein